MIRFKIDKETTDKLDYLFERYKLKKDTIVGRIAISLSFEINVRLSFENYDISSDGREYTPTSNIFGRKINDEDNQPIFKSIFEKYYEKNLSDEEFIKVYKFHLKEGVDYWYKSIINLNFTNGEHISFLLNFVKKGLQNRTEQVYISSNKTKIDLEAYSELISLNIGTDEYGNDVIIDINDVNQFDNRNIAIAGMAGSGKTQLIKEILFQISKQSNNEIKFIFFDYKGEGNVNQIQSFLDNTNSKFIDLIEKGINFNPLLSISLEEREKPFSIRAFVDTISAFVPKLGEVQKTNLINVINDLIDNNKRLPSVSELFYHLNDYYEENGIKQDSLYSTLKTISETNIFNCDVKENIFNQSIYLNLPPALSDTIRQLTVFFLLRYFHNFFSSTNDCTPINGIFPIRYVIVIDEAHIYLKNSNASKALEDILRLLRSKGVITIMLTQGVEDYKTKNFDFASQVKIPICLNINNKNQKLIESFVCTYKSSIKMQTEINKLESGKGLVNLNEPKVIAIKQWWQNNL